MAETWAIDENGNRIPGTGLKIISAERCESEEWAGTGRQCIGVKGHAGDHWRYNDQGDYCWWKDDDECANEWDIAAGMTPCGHAEYIAPSVRHAETAAAHTKSVPIETSEFDD